MQRKKTRNSESGRLNKRNRLRVSSSILGKFTEEIDTRARLMPERVQESVKDGMDLRD